MNMSKGASGYLKSIIVVIIFLCLASSSCLGMHWNVYPDKTTMTPSLFSVSLGGTSVYDLLIIAPDDFSRALKPLVDHKNAMGISTKFVTLDEVYDRMFWHGRDNPEKIKFFIKTAYDQWGISYVLLVGDFRRIPVRYVYNADIEGYPEPCFISELYYADLYDSAGEFSSWDSNENGVYGEWHGASAEDTDIDLSPDIYIGRLACTNVVEVKTMVNKIIEYETTAYGSSWFQRIVVVGGDTYPESLNPLWTGYEGEETNLRVLENMSDFIPVKLWTSDGSFQGPQDVLRVLNNGCGFLYLDGHASPRSWSTHPPNDEDTWIKGLSVGSMTLLHNGNKVPVCVVGGCHNNQFDVHLLRILKDKWYYYTWIPECWGWKLTRKIGGGSIATIGCTGLGMTKEDKESFRGGSDFLEPTFFHEYGVEGIDILGETWGAAISAYLDKYPIDWNTPAAEDSAIDAKTVQQWVILGDPSLKIGGYDLN
jgi:prepilin-type processing-associated H-X9-DG protein